MYKNLKGIHLAGLPESVEHASKISGIRRDAQDIYEAKMKVDIARRYLFWECMDHYGFDDYNTEYFDRKWYYFRNEDRDKLERCFNTRLDMHFGEKFAKENLLYMNFDEMAKQYKKLEKDSNPIKRHVEKYERGYEEDKVQTITSKLLEKTKQKQNGFTFN